MNEGDIKKRFMDGKFLEDEDGQIIVHHIGDSKLQFGTDQFYNTGNNILVLQANTGSVEGRTDLGDLGKIPENDMNTMEKFYLST